MSTTIALVTGTADRPGPSIDGGATYPVLSGKLATTDLVVEGNAPLFDTMIMLANGHLSLPFDDDAFRSDPSWTRVTGTWIAGTAANTGTCSNDRVAAIDLDNADGVDVLRIINWVNHIEGAQLP